MTSRLPFSDDEERPAAEDIQEVTPSLAAAQEISSIRTGWYFHMKREQRVAPKAFLGEKHHHFTLNCLPVCSARFQFVGSEHTPIGNLEVLPPCLTGKYKSDWSTDSYRRSIQSPSKFISFFFKTGNSPLQTLSKGFSLDGYVKYIWWIEETSHPACQVTFSALKEKRSGHIPCSDEGGLEDTERGADKRRRSSGRSAWVEVISSEWQHCFIIHSTAVPLSSPTVWQH